MITSNDAGVYTCHDCGHTWCRRERWLWWPVRLIWVRTWGLGRHGVEGKADGIEQRTFAQVWRIGPLRIVLGSYQS